jgi:hypothetical protein
LEWVVAIATACAALATATAAGFTAWMAAKTRDLATATQLDVEQGQALVVAAQAQAAAGLAAVEATRQPIICPMPMTTATTQWSWTPPGDGRRTILLPVSTRGLIAIAADRTALAVAIPIRNAGTGVAVITDVQLRRVSMDSRPLFGDASLQVVAPGDAVGLIFGCSDSDADWDEWRGLLDDPGSPGVSYLHAKLFYREAAGERLFGTEFDLARVSGTGDLVVLDMEYRIMSL